MPLSPLDFERLVKILGDQARDDIQWSESLAFPSNAEDFASEAIFVICNSGMKNTVARMIFDRCMVALKQGDDVHAAFGHAGKASAISRIWRDRAPLYRGFVDAADRLAYLEGLPWIGPITKYHLAKNFGENFAKPDVHLQRLADLEGCSAQELCDRLAADVGLRAATVDTVLWRACANGVLDSRTGAIRAKVSEDR